MRILISMTNFYMGGAQIFIVNLIRELSARHKVSLYCILPEQSHRELRDRLPGGTPVYFFPVWADRLTARIDHFLVKRDIRIWVNHFCRKTWFLFLIKAKRIQVISSHLFHSDKFVSSVIRDRVPFVITDHGDYRLVTEHGFADRETVRNIFRLVSAVIYLTVENRENLISLAGVEKDIMVKINNGTPASRIKKESTDRIKNDLGIGPEDFVFGMNARGIREKGWEFTIGAFIDLLKERQNLKLLCIGEGPYLLELRERYGNHPNIRFTGQLSDPLPTVACCHAGLLPSYFKGESMPMAVIEFLATGIPVIATDAGSIPEMISRNGRNAGIVIPLTDEGNLLSNMRSAMEKYLVDTSLYEEHKGNCAYCFEMFDIVNVSRSYEEVFEKIIRK